MGTATRVPRLLSFEGFNEWKFRFEHNAKMKDSNIWRSIMMGPQRITYQRAGSTEVLVKPVAQYDDDDFAKVEEDEKALSTLTMALSPEIAFQFRELQSAKELWDELIEVYEGNEDMKRSRQDLLQKKFNMFNHVLGETLESQLQRFISLATEMRTAGILLQTSEINNKLVNSLPKNWDMHVAVIKKTKDLN
ncbi:uncharacterized protein LOC143579576 [Bidens hawaiensis]|uniref:uncharacterized protein LOC143579576 n=1 Tax=Bidens hawaiensis TaxID=980011 RepID=UPI00404AD9E5